MENNVVYMSESINDSLRKRINKLLSEGMKMSDLGTEIKIYGAHDRKIIKEYAAVTHENIFPFSANRKKELESLTDTYMSLGFNFAHTVMELAVEHIAESVSAEAAEDLESHLEKCFFLRGGE